MSLLSRYISIKNFKVTGLIANGTASFRSIKDKNICGSNPFDLAASSTSTTPNGLGDASLSPPSTLTNPQTVGVTAGSSLTVSFVPKSNKSVKTITLDGGTVYSGSTTGATISYTVTNILGPHTLAATFG